jgi:threonine synthase
MYELGPRHVCEDVCFGPLEVVYDYDRIRARVSRATIEAGPVSIWRYRDFLPVAADRLGRVLGLNNLYIKNDGVNMPTLSFKDRVVSVALSRARELGFTTVSCASTGNLANSTAAIAAHAGLDCCVFIPSDLESGKVLGTLVYNPILMAVKGITIKSTVYVPRWLTPTAGVSSTSIFALTTPKDPKPWPMR